MRLIAGLGNPGDDYRESRHNLGFRVVGELARRRRVELVACECQSSVARLGDLLLAAPQTYMNRSGHAVRCLVELHDLAPGQLLVVYDDVSLPLGRLRLRLEGGPGGHRGMESVLESLQSAAVPRLRLGIGPPPEGQLEGELADWVLAPFGREELAAVEAMVERAADACEAWLSEEAERVMNRFNG